MLRLLSFKRAGCRCSVCGCEVAWRCREDGYEREKEGMSLTERAEYRWHGSIHRR